MIQRRITILLISLGLGLFACEPSGEGTIVVSDAWGRSSPASAANAAFYMNIRNNSQRPDSLERVEIDICDSTELHETNIDDAGLMSMSHVMKIDISNGEEISLEPGGFHVMCLGLNSALETGDMIPINLVLANSGTMQIQAEIRER